MLSTVGQRRPLCVQSPDRQERGHCYKNNTYPQNTCYFCRPTVVNSGQILSGWSTSTTSWGLIKFIPEMWQKIDYLVNNINTE